MYANTMSASMGEWPMGMAHQKWAQNNEAPQYEHTQDVRDQDEDDGEQATASVPGLSVDTMAPMTLSPGLSYEESYHPAGAALGVNMDARTNAAYGHMRMVRIHTAPSVRQLGPRQRAHPAHGWDKRTSPPPPTPPLYVLLVARACACMWVSWWWWRWWRRRG